MSNEREISSERGIDTKIEMSSQVAKVKKERLEACMTCPLCNKLLKEATTISLCLHTFCRKCIYEKLSDEEVDCCPVCNIDLGCLPVEKLRPDHNLQDIQAKIFPLKRRKISAPVVPPSVSLPAKRKERSLSSLVVSAPKVPMRTGLSGRRTKAVARKAVLRGCSFPNKGPVKKEESDEDIPVNSSSPEPQNKISRNKMQDSSIVELSYEHKPTKDSDNDDEVIEGKADLWTPLNCLVEAANRTKSSKPSLQGLTAAKPDPQNVPDNGSCINDYKTMAASPNAPDSEMYTRKTKMKGLKFTKVKNKNNGTALLKEPVKRKRMKAANCNKAASSAEMCASAQVMLDATVAKDIRRNSSIWFSLVAAEDRKGDVSLPKISACYLRIKDGKMPVSFIQKYLVKKLDLNSEAEVEILCQGQPVLPTLQLQNLVDLWFRRASTSKKVPASVGSSAKDFVMVLSYCRKVENN